MKRILFALVALAAIALGACRQYDVDVYKNFNGRVLGADGVTESFTCTADSLIWAEFFVGAANDTGAHYEFSILPVPGVVPLYTGEAQAGPSVQYEYTRAELTPSSSEPFIKGKEYVLKVTLDDPNHPNDSLNWYADTTNPYQYGRMFVGGDAPLRWDLCARIEGVNRPTPKDFFGVNSWYTYDSARSDVKYAQAESAGCSWVRELLRWDLLQTASGVWNWPWFDTAVARQARHGLQTLTGQTDCPSWASCHFDAVRTNGDTAWSPTSPPRGLCEPVETLIGGVTQVNPRVRGHNT